MTTLSHKIRLYPNDKQKTYFHKCFGVRRVAYNWALGYCKESYDKKEKHPSGFELSKKLNAIKDEKFPWMREVTKCAAQKAVYDLSTSYKRFFKKKSSYPKYKKKGINDSFYLANDQTKIEDNKIRIPKLGWVRMSQPLRFQGKLLSVTVSRDSDQYYASVTVELDDSYEYPNRCENQASTGIDMGSKDLVVLSDGTKFENPKALKRNQKKLKRLQQDLSRKQKGSKNRAKARLKVAKCHRKIRNVRQDFVHKMTSKIVKSYSFIGIEDLKVKDMQKNERIAKVLTDAPLYEIRRQLEYKSKLSGSDLFVVDKWFPSSQLCSICGWRNKDLLLSTRSWTCPECGSKHDRDINAAQNILKQAACGFREAQNVCGGSSNRSPVKQKDGCSIRSNYQFL